MVITWRQLNKMEESESRPRATRPFLFGIILGIASTVTTLLLLITF